MSWSRFTVKERILLYLYMNPYSIQNLEVSNRITQSGIAEGIDIERKNVPRNVSYLEENRLVISEKKYVPPNNLKHTSYFLTDEGKNRAKKIFDTVEEISVVMNGEALSIDSVMERYPEVTLPVLLKFIDRKNFLDIIALEEKIKSQSVTIDMNGYKADPNFVGRQTEMEHIFDWVNGEHRILQITGVGGIGKSALVKEALFRTQQYNILWFEA